MSDSDSEDSFKSLSDTEHTSDLKPSFKASQTNGQRRDDQSESKPDEDFKTPAKIPRFPPEEEASLIDSSNTLKSRGNSLFGSGSYENAIQTYDRALAEVPNYLDFELAVLRSNIAACHLKLEEWKEAVESAEKGVECLERLEPLPVLKTKGKKTDGEPDKDTEDTGGIEEIDDSVAERIANLEASGHTLDEVRKLQVKLLTRRAKARVETGGWSSLQGADEDYRILLSPTMLPFLSPTDLRNVRESAQRLAPKLNAAKDREMAEMMDKLKGLGNSILSPFGLSTDNFQFVKDEKSGGYSMNFEQNPTKKA